MRKIIKLAKYLAGAFIILFFVVIVTSILFPHIDRATQFDVVMVENELYFVFEKECKVKSVEVITLPETTPLTLIWRISNLIDTYAEDALKMKQIRYGKNPWKFNAKEIPEKLKRNIEYSAGINSSQGPFTGGRDFIIAGSNKIIRTDTYPYNLKNSTVIIEKDGKKMIVPYSYAGGAIVSHPEKGYIANDKFLKQYSQYFRTKNNFATKLWPNIIIALFFVCFFWRRRRLYRKGKQVVYMPLLIPTLAWSLSAVWAIIYICNPLSNLFVTNTPLPSLLIFHINYSPLLPGFLTLATLAGIIPWLISLWRWRRKNRARAAADCITGTQKARAFNS